MRTPDAHTAQRGTKPARILMQAAFAVAASVGAVLPASAASIIPTETYCQHGCDIPEFDQISPDVQIPLTQEENPLRSLSPFQDFIGDVDEDSLTDTDSQWEAPSRPNTN